MDAHVQSEGGSNRPLRGGHLVLHAQAPVEGFLEVGEGDVETLFLVQELCAMMQFNILPHDFAEEASCLKHLGRLVGPVQRCIIDLLQFD